ncbi:hypothetical protein [Rhizobium tropici]|uniref:2-oxoisovalerate dehydrogenase E1 alpha subunit N-terminal domain-containing protein n=1 Tax=Rhizobium tropici TaxID=398 RepID=A0ABR6R2E0_RHITR|nr:hypothetical protein [Rhizobium tropici]MBB5594561.1 hypothetical protein [Rhizobium tropici]MBB6493350.1 hypothetical protein [Rhizobium tropici]
MTGNKLSLTVPEPEFRPGDQPDFSHFDVPRALWITRLPHAPIPAVRCCAEAGVQLA